MDRMAKSDTNRYRSMEASDPQIHFYHGICAGEIHPSGKHLTISRGSLQTRCGAPGLPKVRSSPRSTEETRTRCCTARELSAGQALVEVASGGRSGLPPLANRVRAHRGHF